MVVTKISTIASKVNWALLAILMLGLGLRFWGINFGLPYTYASDEPTYLTITLKILETGDLNPHWWFYPSLIFYLNGMALLAYFLVGLVVGAFRTMADIPFPQIISMGVGKLAMPGEFLVTRGLTALFSAGSIALVYLIARRLHPSKTAALLAAVLAAISPTVVDNSQRIDPDIFALFFLLVSFFFAIQIAESPNLHNYFGAGIGAGLAIASKYNAGLIVLPLLLAHFLRFGRAGIRRNELYLGLLATAIAFVVVTPYSILDFPGFWDGLRFQAFSYTVEGHAGQEGNAFQWYVSFLWQNEGLMSLLGAIGGLYLLATRSQKNIVTLSFPLIYFVFISQLLIRNARTVMLIIPFLALFAAILLVTVYEWFDSQGVRREIISAGLAVVSILLIVSPLQSTLAADYRLTQVDSRETARVWLNENLPTGSRVAQEAYTPYLDTRRFVVQGVYGIIDHTPDWYVQNGFEYLVFSQGMYGRFFAEPDRYQTWVDKYNEIFSRFSEIKRFNDNGYEVRIYKTGVVLPPHRVAARFGNEGELIELVGYDDVAQTWMPGQPLKLKLTWRTIEQKSEPFEVELRLLDKDGREVGSAGGDLFQGQGWREGMFSTDWTIPVQASAAPGAYQLEVSVIESQFAYRTLAQNWSGDKLDRVVLAPFKLSVTPPTANELQTLHTADVRFGEAIGLLGYTPPGDARLGSSLPLTLYWQSLAKPSTDYTVFVHLVDANGKVVAQVDAQPRGGAYPTSLWDASEIIADGYDLQVPADLAPGTYRVEIGLYEYPSLTRLPAVDAKGNSLGDHWVLPEAIQVVQ